MAKDLSEYTEIQTYRVDNPDERSALGGLNNLLKEGWQLLATGFGQYSSPVKEEGRIVGFSQAPTHLFTLGRTRAKHPPAAGTVRGR